MADEIVIFDAAGSNPDGTDPGSALSIGPGTNYPITEASFPAPPLNVTYSSSVDTEGELPVSRRYGNRTITLKMEMAESAANDTLLHALQAKVAKFQREGGTLKRTLKDGTTVRIYDIVAGEGWDPAYDFKYILGNVSEVTIQLPAKPLARGVEVDLGDNVETTLPALVFTEASIAGDVPALGRLVIDNDVVVDQWWVTWGIQSRYYDAATSAALFYEAEGRTAQGGSATAAGPSGASGAGSNVMRNTALTTSYQSVLSTQVSGGGAHLSHIGSFRVYARVQVPATNTGEVSIALEWGEGDFRRFTQNATWTMTREGSWVLADLGLVTLNKVAAGTQRWEGRIVAKSTVLGDDIDIDFLMLIPVDEGSGVVQGVHRSPSPTSFVARDEFDQTAGALNTKVAPVGGTWATSGTATDFQVSGAGVVTRNAGTEAEWAGRFAILGTTNYTDVAGEITVSGLNVVPNLQVGLHGLVLRYVDASNWLAIVHNPGANDTDYELAIVKNIAGTKTTIAWMGQFWALGGASGYAAQISATVSAAGVVGARLILSGTTSGLDGTYTLGGQDATLATGGTLATGKPGFYSDRRNAAATYTFDNFRVSAPPPDAAMFASQSLQIRHDRVIREDPGGTLWVQPSNYVGDYLLVPPSGAEARTTRVIVKASRAAPEENSDSAIDDISARLFVTPRYL